MAKVILCCFLVFVITQNSLVQATIYDKCGLAQALSDNGMPRDQLENCKLFIMLGIH